jgi:HB1, ASXL, restriction endonuclease HTH domain
MAGAQAKAHQSFREAAHQILAQAGVPLKPDEIVERALAAGLIATRGKTPPATMAAQLYTEIKQHGASSIVVKVGKGRFGLRAWGDGQGQASKAAVPSTKVAGGGARVVPISTNPVDGLIAEVMTAQYESFNSIHFEQVLTRAFATLGFAAQHIGGAGRTDILLDASVSAASYRVVVDAKSNKNGKIGDQNID